MTTNPPIQQIAPDCPTDLLMLDPSNPRLEDGAPDGGQLSEKDLILALRNVGALPELIASITANGYKKIEPMVIHGPDEGPYTVLEGNRRLACIKLLKNPKLAEECGITVPNPVPQVVLDSIQSVPVWRVANPEDAKAFIGFKHINGPHKWESFAKARFVTQWWKDGKTAGLTIPMIAEKLGDDNNTIRNMIAGMLVLEQAQANGFDIGDRANRGRFAFSHLYTALTRSEYSEFLGLDKGWNQKPVESPVPVASVERLKEVMLWIYGSKAKVKQAQVKSQNPDLADLGEALKHPIALEVLRAGRSLAEARAEFRPVDTLLSEALVGLDAKLREAVQLAGRTEKASAILVQISEQIFIQAKSLATLLRAAGDEEAA